MTRRSAWAVFLCLLLSVVTVTAAAQPTGGTIRVLVVDETKTFASTMRVAGLVGALRKVPIFQVGFVLSDAATEWEDPLAGQVNDEEPYDLAVLLPRGLDTGSAQAVWVVSGGLGTLRNDVSAAIGIIAEIAAQVFPGTPLLGVSDDLFPAVLWGLYVTKGWMR